jgi:hypothetical protein
LHTIDDTIFLLSPKQTKIGLCKQDNNIFFHKNNTQFSEEDDIYTCTIVLTKQIGI